MATACTDQLIQDDWLQPQQHTWARNTRQGWFERPSALSISDPTATARASHLPGSLTKPSERSGPTAQELNLTHFVDDKLANLDGMHATGRCECLLFTPHGADDAAMPGTRCGRGHYLVVADWAHLLQILLQP